MDQGATSTGDRDRVDTGGVEGVVVMVRVELPLIPGVSPTNTGFRDVESPLGDSATVTFNVIRVVRPRLSTVILDDVKLPAIMLGGERLLAVRVKSGVTVIV